MQEKWKERHGLVADKIKSALKDKGIGNKQFANMMDVQPSTVTKWLKGNHNFQVKTIWDIEWVLGIRLINLDISQKLIPMNNDKTTEQSIPTSGKLTTVKQIVEWIDRDMAEHHVAFPAGDNMFVNGAMTALKNLRSFIDLHSLPPSPVGEVGKPFNLSEADIKVILDKCLKPEEIAGEPALQHDRVDELIRWFSRGGNPKWFQSHAYELVYYIATNSVNRFVDLEPVRQKAYYEGINIPANERSLLERHFPEKLIAPSPNPSRAGEISQVLNWETVVEWLRVHKEEWMKKWLEARDRGYGTYCAGRCGAIEVLLDEIPPTPAPEVKEEPIFKGQFSVNDGKLDFVCTTKGVSFEEVKDGLTKMRDEINRQLSEEKKCPHYNDLEKMKQKTK